jgi:DNA repair ATPase RecN
MVPRRPGAYDLGGTMLRRLRIENLVLIQEAELTFAPGLNAITGETGAGKTILAQAIGLLLGAKGDAGYIGANGTESYVEAELDLPAGLLDEDELSRSPISVPRTRRGSSSLGGSSQTGVPARTRGGAVRHARTWPPQGSG